MVSGLITLLITVKMSEKHKTSECSEGQYEFVPPEGGWGYVVCVGLSVIFVSVS